MITYEQFLNTMEPRSILEVLILDKNVPPDIKILAEEFLLTPPEKFYNVLAIAFNLDNPSSSPCEESKKLLKVLMYIEVVAGGDSDAYAAPYVDIVTEKVTSYMVNYLSSYLKDDAFKLSFLENSHPASLFAAFLRIRIAPSSSALNRKPLLDCIMLDSQIKEVLAKTKTTELRDFIKNICLLYPMHIPLILQDPILLRPFKEKGRGIYEELCLEILNALDERSAVLNKKTAISLFSEESFSNTFEVQKTLYFQKCKDNFVKTFPQDKNSQVSSLFKLSLFACAKLEPSETTDNYFSDEIDILRI